jgi:hypothetical protein
MLDTLQIYEPQPLRRELIHLVVDEPPPRSYDLASRKGRALLGADIKSGLIDLRDKPVAYIAKALCASARSMHQAPPQHKRYRISATLCAPTGRSLKFA